MLALLFCVTAWGQGSLEVLEEELARGLAVLADEAQPVHYAAVALETVKLWPVVQRREQ